MISEPKDEKHKATSSMPNQPERDSKSGAPEGEEGEKIKTLPATGSNQDQPENEDIAPETETPKDGVPSEGPAGDSDLKPEGGVDMGTPEGDPKSGNPEKEESQTPTPPAETDPNPSEDTEEEPPAKTEEGLEGENRNE